MRVVWVVLAVVLAGLVFYMYEVGWSKAFLIAGIAGFFVAVAGLALAVADRSDAGSHSRGGSVVQRLHRADGENVRQSARVIEGTDLAQDMTKVAAKAGAIRQVAKVVPRPGRPGIRGGGKGDGRS